MLSRQGFTPWGELRAGGGDVAQTTRDFTGQLKDGTGLLFYHARYYDPKLGRFLSADTVAPEKAAPQRRNRYSYTRNNPLTYIDPSGHDPLDNACAAHPEREGGGGPGRAARRRHGPGLRRRPVQLPRVPRADRSGTPHHQLKFICLHHCRDRVEMSHCRWWNLSSMGCRSRE